MEQEFKPTRIINPGTLNVPKTGHIGYVKVEKKHYGGPKLEPKIFTVDSYEYDTVL